MWQEKARRLNIPLSAKGHPVGQQGVFTGVAIDTFRGRYKMLPEKLEALVVARNELAAAATSTPRRIGRVRGKAMHYGCAIPFVAVAAPSLSQLMHNRETGTGPVLVPSLDEEADSEYDWDKELPISNRAKDALEYMRIALERYGTAGQPLWPVVPSSLYGAFLDGEASDVRLLVITFDASVHGWGAVIRASPHEPGVEVVGGYRQAHDLLGGAYIEPSALPKCPVAQVYREALAGLLATHAASLVFPLADFTVMIRNDCVGALSALRKGSHRSPALQNVALLHNRLFMDLGAMPPLYLFAPGVVMKAEGIDGLSREGARSMRASDSLPALRSIVIEEATRRFEASISLDLFATADNTLVPRFCARYPEPLAECVDAMAQPDWSRSRCGCNRVHLECVFAFPPRALLPQFVAKARADGLRGVVVVPFTPSDPTWPAFAAASLTTIEGQRDPCIILSDPAAYVRDGDALGGAQRWPSWRSTSAGGACVHP